MGYVYMNLEKNVWQVIGQNLVVQCSNDKSCLLTRDHWVYRFEYKDQQLSAVCRIPVKDRSILGLLKDFIARNRFYQMIFPTAGIGHVIELKSQKLLIIYDQIYCFNFDSHDRNASIISSNIIPKVAPPLRGGIAIHGISQHVYYGEYLNKHTRDIRIVRVDVEQKTVEVCWQFTRSQIKHVHSIHYDKFRNRLWICTGDTDSESAIYYTDDEFKTIKKLGGGAQCWRAISMLFTSEYIEWGMDAGQDAPASCINKIYRYQFESNQLIDVVTLGNPIYAACSYPDGTAVVATTFEPKRTQDTPASAQIWYRNKHGEWSVIAEFPYQKNNRQGVSSYGMAYLPYGELPLGVLLTTPVNSQKFDYSALLTSIPK